MVIRKGTKDDIDAVSALYNEVCDYLQTHINYPGWRKGIYPDRQDAERGIGEDSLFVAEVDGEIAGTFILRHQPEAGYALADWKNELSYSDIFVVYTLAVSPRFSCRGIGERLMEFILYCWGSAWVQPWRGDAAKIQTVPVSSPVTAPGSGPFRRLRPGARLCCSLRKKTASMFLPWRSGWSRTPIPVFAFSRGSSASWTPVRGIFISFPRRKRKRRFSGFYRKNQQESDRRNRNGTQGNKETGNEAADPAPLYHGRWRGHVPELGFR